MREVGKMRWKALLLNLSRLAVSSSVDCSRSTMCDFIDFSPYCISINSTGFLVFLFYKFFSSFQLDSTKIEQCAAALNIIPPLHTYYYSNTTAARRRPPREEGRRRTKSWKHARCKKGQVLLKGQQKKGHTTRSLIYIQNLWWPPSTSSSCYLL